MLQPREREPSAHCRRPTEKHHSRTAGAGAPPRALRRPEARTGTHIVLDDHGVGAIPIEDVLEFPLILPGKDDSIRRVIEEAAMSVGLPVRPEYEVQSVAATINLVKAGFGCTILPPPVIASIRDASVESHAIMSPVLRRELRRAVGPGSQNRPATRKPPTELLHELQRMVVRTLRKGAIAAPWRDACTFFDGP